MEKKISCIIIDDEPGNVIALQEMLRIYCDEIKVLATASNAEEGRECIINYKPQLVFLDIEMPYGNAFDMLDKFDTVDFEIIFITAFDNYAVKAFKYAVLDYILKPVNIQELKKAVAKAAQYVLQKNENHRVKLLLNNLKLSKNGELKINLVTEDGIYLEELKNISYLEASGSYTFVFTNKKKYTISKSLKEFEDILPEELFCRVHHSYIINIAAIKKYNKGRGGVIEMENGALIDVSVRKKEYFLDWLQQHR